MRMYGGVAIYRNAQNARSERCFQVLSLATLPHIGIRENCYDFLDQHVKIS